MPYKIVITRTREEEVTAGKEWVTLSTMEVERDRRFINDDPNGPKTRIEEKRGYSPEIVKKMMVERQVLIQEVDDLDVPAVIRAINGL